MQRSWKLLHSPELEASVICQARPPVQFSSMVQPPTIVLSVEIRRCNQGIVSVRYTVPKMFNSPTYKRSLHKCSNSTSGEPPLCPGTLEWSVAAYGDLNRRVNSGDDAGSLSALQEIRTPAMANDDLLGDLIPDKHQFQMQKYICSVLGVPCGRRSMKFPGSHPVSLDRKNIQLMKKHYYCASCKADGTRYMMFLTRNGCFLIDRNFRFRRVQFKFPLKNLGDSETHHLTLLDGEMVIDLEPDSEVKLRRYLVYDLMILNSRPLVKLPFSERWKLIKDEVIDPHLAEKQKGTSYMYDAEKFMVRRKDFWMLSNAEKFLRDVMPKLPHKTDGLILQRWDDLYRPWTHEGLLKWKYPWMNSVDFLLKISISGQFQLYLLERGGKFKQLDGAQVTFPGQDPTTMVGKIVECRWKQEENLWEFMRIRKDKETPNAWHVYEKVLGSVQDKITQEVLLEEIQEICRLPLYMAGQ